ncbi:hypothetical protein [Fictibacillus terranigra]|uniref:Uncharacterized protein n=1 Tax=Fictibacillus terranigra TaxID=3058424 RepID=A0ABT8EA20_9BACL|nr:hypothetical protein [Fictibacillus sp. CENA-BCM004]MDN4074739.1 hypothetical protein [Fictibacillus sp. CENA-BCM004]
MSLFYGIEMKPAEKKLPATSAQIVRKTAELAKVIDRCETIVIVKTMEEALALKEYYETQNLFEELHPLLSPAHFQPTGRFQDYGFQSVSQRHYLFEDTVLSFRVNRGTDQEISMFLFQLDEHLIGTDQEDDGSNYFVDREEKELIQKYASAYNVIITARS